MYFLIQEARQQKEDLRTVVIDVRVEMILVQRRIFRCQTCTCKKKKPGVLIST